MSKTKGLFFTLELQPYRYGLVVSIGQTDAQLKRSMERIDKKHGVERVGDVMEALKTPGPGFCCLWEADGFMYIREIPVTVQSQGVVVHELLHIIQHCMKSRGMKLSGVTSQEAYCYLTEQAWNDVMGRVARSIQ